MAKKKGARGKYNPDTVDAIILLLERGNTQRDAAAGAGITEETYYQWLKDTTKPEFAERVTRAQGVARQQAIDTLLSAFLDREITDTTEEIIEEPLLDSKRQPVLIDGKPFIVTRKRTTHTKRIIPGDWRAGVEYLKRRDSAHWSEKVQQAILSADVTGDTPIDKDTIRKAAEEMKKWFDGYSTSD